jgi:hypothetical protein
LSSNMRKSSFIRCHRQDHSHPSHPTGHVRRGKMSVLLSLGTLSPSSALRDSIHPGNADLPIGFMYLNPIRQYGDWRSREGREERGRAINCATTNEGGKTRKHRKDACRNIVHVAIQELLIRIDTVKYGNLVEWNTQR